MGSASPACPRDEHLVHLDHPHRRRHQAARAGDRNALHEPRPGDAARGDHPGAATSQATYETDGDPLETVRQGPGGMQRLPGLHLQPDPHAHDQRGRLRPHGGRRGAEGHRRHHGPRDEPPHGPAGPGRPHRTRHLLGHHGRALPGLRRFQVPSLPAPEEVRRRRATWAGRADAASTITANKPSFGLQTKKEDQKNGIQEYPLCRRGGGGDTHLQPAQGAQRDEFGDDGRTPRRGERLQDG